MDFQPIDLPGVREEQERLVRGRGEEGHDKILFLDAHPDLALAASPLRPIEGDRVALDVAGMRNRDDHFFVRDHVFQGDLRFFFHDLRAAVVLVGLAHLDQLILDDRANQRFAAQDRLEMLDLLQDLFIFLDEFVALQLREPLEPHLQNRIRLDFAQRKLPHQAGSGFIGRLRPSDQGNHRIQVIERDLETLEDMGPLFRLAQLEGGPTDDDFAPMLDEMMQDLLEVQHFRPVVHQREHDDPEGRLELRELIQIVQRDERDFPALELDDDADAFPIGFVAQIGNPFDPFVLDQLGDLLDQLGLIDLIGQLRDDQPFAIRAFIRSRSSLSRAT